MYRVSEHTFFLRLEFKVCFVRKNDDIVVRNVVVIVAWKVVGPRDAGILHQTF
jgi:hypothetical protein